MTANETDQPTDPDQEVGLRERQKQARRDALVDAAHHLVAEHGIDAVSVEDICAAAGVSRRTFFNYFASKDDAVLAFEPWHNDAEVDETFTGGGPTGTTREDLAYLVRHLVSQRTLGRDRVGRAMELARKEPALGARQLAAFEEHRRHIVDLVRRRLPEAQHADVELVAMTIVTITHSTFVRWEATDPSSDPAEHVDAAVEALRQLLA